MNCTLYFLTNSEPRIRSSSPNRCNGWKVNGNMDSPMWYRGNFSLSSTSTRCPFSANNAAAEDPAGPAPMINTSDSVVIYLNFKFPQYSKSNQGLTIAVYSLGAAARGRISTISESGRCCGSTIVAFRP